MECTRCHRAVHAVSGSYVAPGSSDSVAWDCEACGKTTCGACVASHSMRRGRGRGIQDALSNPVCPHCNGSMSCVTVAESSGQGSGGCLGLLVAFLLPAILAVALAACDQKPPGPSMPSDAVLPEKSGKSFPSKEACHHWLYNHDVLVNLPGVADPWKFRNEDVSEMKVLWLRENPGHERKPLLATISFRVTAAGKTFTVRGTIGYRESTQFESMLVYEDYVTEAVE